jgi:hypothetical protein
VRKGQLNLNVFTPDLGEARLPVPALVVPCTMMTVVTNRVLPAANEEIHARVSFSDPSLSGVSTSHQQRGCR